MLTGPLPDGDDDSALDSWKDENEPWLDEKASGEPTALLSLPCRLEPFRCSSDGEKLPPNPPPSGGVDLFDDVRCVPVEAKEKAGEECGTGDEEEDENEDAKDVDDSSGW